MDEPDDRGACFDRLSMTTGADAAGLRDDDGSFDIDFWDRYTPSERMMLVWTMAVEEHIASGRDPAELSFQRSVGGLRRRRRRTNS